MRRGGSNENDQPDSGETNEVRYDWGPLRLTIGPQDDGGYGALLKGEGVHQFDLQASKLPACPEHGGSTYYRPIALVELAVDAGYSSVTGATNNTLVALRPMFGAEIGRNRVYDATQTRQQCIDREQESRSRSQNEEVTDSGARTDSDSEGLPSDADDLILDQEEQKKRARIHLYAPKTYVTVLPFLDYSLRDADVEVGGAITSVRQEIRGGGLLIMLPQAMAASGFWQDLFLDIPRLTVGYYEVEDNSAGAIPLPAEVTADHVVASLSLETRFPMFNVDLAASPFLFIADFTYSQARKGPAKGKSDNLRTMQLIYDTEGELKPAITYRSGSNLGVEYDKQLILGILWDFGVVPRQKN